MSASVKTPETKSGQSGNLIPISGIPSTESLLVNHAMAMRRPVVAIDAIAYTVNRNQSGTLFTYGGQSCGVTITVPKPEPGRPPLSSSPETVPVLMRSRWTRTRRS
jgi:hypothetical protein